jgi:hypothetical protein
MTHCEHCGHPAAWHLTLHWEGEESLEPMNYCTGGTWQQPCECPANLDPLADALEAQFG